MPYISNKKILYESDQLFCSHQLNLGTNYTTETQNKSACKEKPTLSAYTAKVFANLTYLIIKGRLFSLQLTDTTINLYIKKPGFTNLNKSQSMF